ncbi:MAG: hypothetical protein WC437_00815 [Patescibacteria group bacterium]|nr:hypothetical protein [Patescibacteria group bacterium]
MSQIGKLLGVYQKSISNVALKVKFDRRRQRKCDYSVCQQMITKGMTVIIVSDWQKPRSHKHVFCSETCYEAAGGSDLLQT